MEITPMSMSGNLEENWKLWKKKFDIYLTAKDLKKESQERLCALALSLIGDEAFNTYNDKIDNEDAVNDDLESLLEQFESLFTPKINLTYERFKLFNTKQFPGVSTETFVKLLKEKAEKCDFGDLKHDLIKIALISGLRDEVIRSQLLRNEQMTLQEIVDYCKMVENLKKANEDLPTDAVNRDKSGSSNSASNYCGFCGRTHPIRKCPAFGTTCSICKQRNHFEKMCRRRNQNNSKRNNQA